MDVKAFQKEVQKKQFQFLDYVNKPQDGLVFQIRDELQRLEDDAQTQKHPENLRRRLETLRSLVKDASEREVVSFAHADALLDWIDDSIRNIR